MAQYTWKEIFDQQGTFVLDGAEIAPSTVTQLFGILIDETFFFNGHIRHLTRNCYQLHRIKAIHCYVPTSIAIQLLRAFVLSWIDCCNSVLPGPARYSVELLSLS